MSWQPIETAPRDGTPVLLYEKDAPVPGAIRIGRWNARYRRFGDAEAKGKWDGQKHPTHWMPLPEPPQ